MAIEAAKLQGIKDRVALGRKQGGNPDYNGETNVLYHHALNDLETLIGAVEVEKVENETPALRTKAEEKVR